VIPSATSMEWSPLNGWQSVYFSLSRCFLSARVVQLVSSKYWMTASLQLSAQQNIQG
jgi:hypothetical protein